MEIVTTTSDLVATGASGSTATHCDWNPNPEPQCQYSRTHSCPRIRTIPTHSCGTMCPLHIGPNQCPRSSSRLPINQCRSNVITNIVWLVAWPLHPLLHSHILFISYCCYTSAAIDCCNTSVSHWGLTLEYLYWRSSSSPITNVLIQITWVILQ